MRNRAERVRGLIDQMADGHSDILSDLVRFNTNELRAYKLEAVGKNKLAELYLNRADLSLNNAAEVMIDQAQRLKHLAWELQRQ